MLKEQEKVYLGDAVYVEHDGFHLVLTTNNGLRDTNTIALDPEVYEALTRYVNRLIKAVDRRET